MQTEAITIDTPAGVNDVKSWVLLQLIGAAVGNSKMISVRALFTNARKYGHCDLTYSEFLQCMNSFRDEFHAGDGELGADVNYIKMKPEV